MTNSDFYNKINEFKKTYRFGQYDEETTIFRQMFIGMFMKLRTGNFNSFKVDQLLVLPSPSKFDIHIDVLTFVKKIRWGITTIIQSIISRSNIKGNPNFDIRDKKIGLRSQFKKDKKTDRYIAIISIIDYDSYALCQTQNILGGDLRKVRENFKSLCDWNISAFFPSDNKCYTISILSANSKFNLNPRIKETQTPVDGFTHELIFYNPIQ